jgi:chromate reductase, NAD(P)H dehydrogenase (quinone)
MIDDRNQNQIRLLGLCGSLRRASLNRALLVEIAALLPTGATLEIDDSLAEFPLFNSDIKEDPAPVLAMKSKLAASHGLVIACPEYNYSVTGALKNGLDWLSRPPATSPMRRKPIGIVGGAAGMSGSMRAQAHLRQMLVFSDSPTMNQPEVLIPRQFERFSVDGRLTDESTRDLLRAFAVAMVAHVRRYTNES